MDQDSVNDQEPARDTMDSLETLLITTEQVSGSSADAGRASTDQNLKNNDDQTKGPGKIMQHLTVPGASEQGTEIQPTVSPNATQSTVLREESSPETNLVMHEDTQPHLTETSDPDDRGKGKEKSNPDPLGISELCELYYSTTDVHVDEEAFFSKRTREIQKIPTQQSRTKDAHSAAKYDNSVMSTSIATVNVRMTRDIERKTQQWGRTTSTQPFQITAGAENSSVLAPNPALTNRNGKKNDEMGVEYKHSTSNKEEAPFLEASHATPSPSTEKLPQSQNAVYLHNEFHGSRTLNSMSDINHQELPSSSTDTHMPNNGFPPANATILNDGNDPSVHKHINCGEVTHFNSSAHLKTLDGQIPVLRLLRQPMKASIITKENAILSHSDTEAGMWLRKLVQMRLSKKALTLSDINEAIRHGKPHPPLLYITEEGSEVKSKEPPESQVDQRRDEVTQNISWVTGCNYMKQYFCWPCLLFGEIFWNISISMRLSDICNATKDHQSKAPHMSAFIKLLVHEATLKRQQEAELEKQLEYKKKTERLLQILIEITCSNTKGSAEEHAEMLALACSFNDDLQGFIEENADDFLVSFVASKLGLIKKALERLMVAKIVEEVQNAPYVSIIFEDTSDVVDKSLVAVILRFVTDSGVSKERLIKFIKMGMSRTAAVFLQIIHSVVQKFKLTEKLVGFTYSGTLVSPNELLIFNKTVNRIYSRATFFPYQEHNLKKIITQSLSHLDDCRNFFYTVEELSGFLKSDEKTMKILGAFLESGEQNQQWDFAKDFITMMKYEYGSIWSFFNHVIDSTFDWDPVTVMQVENYSLFLGSPECRVLISVISAILEVINDLSNVMEDNVDIDLWNRLLSESTNALSNMKNRGLISILRGNNPLIDASEYAKMNSLITPELYHQIIDTCMIVINHRCADLEWAFVGPRHIEAAADLEPQRLAVFLQRTDVNPEGFSKLKEDARKISEAQGGFYPFLADKNLQQSIKHIQDSKTDCEHLHRFLQLCLTIPTKDAYSADSSPATLLLRSYIEKNKHPKFFDMLAFMGKDLLTSMQLEEQFYDQVIGYVTQNDQ